MFLMSFWIRIAKKKNCENFDFQNVFSPARERQREFCLLLLFLHFRCAIASHVKKEKAVLYGDSLCLKTLDEFEFTFSSKFKILTFKIEKLKNFKI